MLKTLHVKESYRKYCSLNSRIKVFSFQKGSRMQESKQEDTNVVSLVKHGGNLPKAPSCLATYSDSEAKLQ